MDSTFGGDMFGWLFFLLTFSLPLLSAQLRRDQSAYLCGALTIFLHNSAAVVHCYLVRLPSSAGDAAGFQQAACDIAVGRQPRFYGNEPFTQFLGLLYSVCGSSEFVGCEASVVAFAASLIPFVALIDWLGLARRRCPLILIYGLLPAKILYCCVPLRESYEVLAFLTLICCLARINDSPREPLNYISSGLCMGLLTLSHRSLIIYLFLLATVGIAWIFCRRHSTIVIVSVGFVALPLLLALLLKSPIEESSSPKQADASDLVAYSIHYRETIGEGRANYGLTLDLSSPQGLLTTLPMVFIYYMFSPLPWQVNGLSDLYAILESTCRLALFISGLYFVQQNRSKDLKPFFILIAFVCLEFLWSAGTSNWGQAIRHRVIAWGLLVLLGGNQVCEAVIKYLGDKKTAQAMSLEDKLSNLS